jgi:pyridoxine kinase
MARVPGTIIAISSHVAHGGVGNRGMVFALERLGFETWSVPTILLPRHFGYGPQPKIVPEPHAFALLLDALVAGGRAREVAGIVSGFFASAGQIEATAALVAAVKSARPEALYLCDPVIGDLGRLYVGEGLATLLRDTLLPLADMATPNAFECRWLSGAADDEPLADAAARLPVPTVLVTSAPSPLRGRIANLLVEGGRATLFEHHKVETAAKGTGDLLAALLLARRLAGLSAAEAAERATATLAEITTATAEAGAPELLLAEHQEAIVAPRADVSVRRLNAHKTSHRP